LQLGAGNDFALALGYGGEQAEGFFLERDTHAFPAQFALRDVDLILPELQEGLVRHGPNLCFEGVKDTEQLLCGNSVHRGGRVSNADWVRIGQFAVI